MDSDNVTNIIKYIIRFTPYGHLKETIENLKTLVGASVIEEKEVQDEIAVYEEDHMRQVNLGDDKIIVSKFNKDDENYYHEQSKNIKIQIQPLNENIEKIVETESSPDNTHAFRQLLDKLLQEYKNKCYKSGITAVNTFFKATSSDTWKIYLIISAHNLNYKNYWTGEWLSWWELNKVDSSNYILKGHVRANTYYYEEGNIQFNLKSDYEEKLTSSSEDETLAKDVLNLIENRENKIQLDLDQVYDNFSDNYIKPLRRKLPVTGQKMNWNLNQIGINK